MSATAPRIHPRGRSHRCRRCLIPIASYRRLHCGACEAVIYDCAVDVARGRHAHLCPECFEHVTCWQTCTTEPDFGLTNDGTPLAATTICDACVKAAVRVLCADPSCPCRHAQAPGVPSWQGPDGLRREVVEIDTPADIRAVVLTGAQLARSRWFQMKTEVA
jgi:hypothetical protein